MSVQVAQLRFDTLEVEIDQDVASVQLNRPHAANSINDAMLCELHEILDLLAESAVRVIVLRGDERAFCTGMDFNAYTDGMTGPGRPAEGPDAQVAAMTRSYMDLLKKLSLHPCIIVTVVEGKVLAGGVGIVAASDYALAADGTTFGLSEVIWGLLPAMVLPYLIRRVGHQPAYRMTMLSGTMTAEQAAEIDLVDQCLPPDQLDRAFGALLRQLRRLHAPVAPVMKSYFRDISNITDDIEDHAVRTTASRSQDELVQANIAAFTRHGRLPWSTR